MNKNVTKNKEGELLVSNYFENPSANTKEKAVRAFLPLVKYVIGRMNLPFGGVMSREDIYQYGVVGLLDALDRFKPSFGVNFKTYAYKRVHGEVVDAIRKIGILNRDQSSNLGKLQVSRDKLLAQSGKQPTPAEVCELANVSEEDYYKIQMMSQMNFTLSLDDALSSDEGEKLSRKDTIIDSAQQTPDDVLTQETIKLELKGIIEKLPDRERLILALYYYEELTLFDIGQVLVLSESRISQILSQTLAVLKKKINR